MSQSDVASEYNEDKMQTTGDGNSLFKLPKISNGHSRASMRSRGKKQRKSPYGVDNNKQFRNSDERNRDKNANKIRYGGKVDREDFTM